jgi:type IV pilus assembly protein PilY1
MTFVLSGTGTRKFKAWENGSGAVPRLKVRYDQNSAVGGCNTKQVVTTIASAADDIEEASPAHPSLSNGTMIENDSLDNINHLGLRFQGVAIPQGATITSAYLLMTARSDTNSVASTTIKAVSSDDMLSWSFADFDVSSQATVPNTVVWNQDEWITDRTYKSQDISAVIQDVVNQAGWDEDNSIGIITTAISSILDNHSAYSAAEDDFDKKPKLVIAYDTPFELGVRTVRDELSDLVAGLTATGSTPVSGVMAEAAAYYRGEDVYFGQNRGFAPNDTQRRYYRTSNPESYSGGTVNLPAGCYDAESSIKECHGETITGSPTYQSPIADVCQTNNIVLLSDGIPNNNFSETRSLIEPIIVGDGNTDDGFPGYADCVNALDGIDCSIKLAEAISKEDQETVSFNGIQTIQTHTIGFDLAAGGAAADFLENLADAGQGGSYSANNAGSLVDVFEAIINSLERESRTFVSPGVSVNQSNRLTHRDELYFGLFKPDTDTVWDGNLKRYRIINGVIHDSVPAVAVNADGRFNDLAQSFWSATADGDEVAEGGAASKMTTTRSVYSNLTADPLTNDNNKVVETNLNILETDVAAIDAADRTRILRWARGLDAGGNARKEMGDALHSTPVVATYDDGSADGNPQVFVGTNQGYLHAIATASGIENWSFIPKQLLKNLTLFQNNTVVSNHVYGIDGNLSIYHEDTDHDSKIDSGEVAILYAGMRRGGRDYFAIDISERLAPKLQFIIQGGSGDYSELGQSWSRLTQGKIRFNGSERRVLVFGGGYDTNQDNIGLHSADSVGRTVFIVDALTGAKLWDARSNSIDPISGTSAVSNLTNSIPADIKAVDLSGSGYIEHIYAADTAGQVFRFDVDNYGNTGASDLVVGGRLANLQTGTVTEDNNRRFFYAPDVSAIKRPTFSDFIAVSIGSGYRAHPVNNGINDKFYVIRDTWVLNANSFPNLPGDVDENDLANVSTSIGDTNSDNISDALALIEDAISPKHGWQLDFLQTGEKVLAESITFNEKVIFTTYRPSLSGIGTGVCSAPEGVGRAYILNIIDGTPAIDTNTDGDLLDLTTGIPDDTVCGDRCLELGRGIPASGLILFQPEGATICFGTQCFDNLLTFNGERLQRIKWRKRRGF